MSSLIDFVGDVVSTVLVGDSHDVERLYLLTRDRRVIRLTLQFFAMDIYDGGAYISDCVIHAPHEMSMGEWRRLVRGEHVILHGSFHALANRRKYIYRLLNTPRCIMALPSGFAHYAADTGHYVGCRHLYWSREISPYTAGPDSKCRSTCVHGRLALSPTLPEGLFSWGDAIPAVKMESPI